MLSIQIDAKSIELIIKHQSTTSSCPSLQTIWNKVLQYVSLLDSQD